MHSGAHNLEPVAEFDPSWLHHMMRGNHAFRAKEYQIALAHYGRAKYHANGIWKAALHGIEPEKAEAVYAVTVYNTVRVCAEMADYDGAVHTLESALALYCAALLNDEANPAFQTSVEHGLTKLKAALEEAREKVSAALSTVAVTPICTDSSFSANEGPSVH